MKASHPSRAKNSTASSAVRPGSTLIVVLAVLVVLALLGGLGWYYYRTTRASVDADPILHRVERGLFNHVVVEQGDIESSKNIELRCEVKARAASGPSTSIVEVVAEGSVVKEGDVLVKLDSAALEQEHERQELVCNLSATAVITAENLYDAAKIAKLEYLSGAFVQAQQLILSEIFVAQENVRRAQQTARFSERLAAKGYVNALQLEADQFAVEKAKSDRDVAGFKLTALEEYTKKKEEKRLDSDIQTAESKRNTEQRNQAIEQKKLSDIKAQIAKCTIKAPAAGQVVYANISNSRGGSSEFVVEPGAPVREQQAILRLPDASYMQVKAKVNEARVTLVKVGMPVVIKCDALEGETLAGEVTKVNQYAEPTSYFGSSTKVYSTFIKIIDPPPETRTGLTAQVSIQVDRRENVLQLPMQAVVEHGGKTYCLVMGKEKHFVPREIEIGASNDKFVMVNDGPQDTAAVRNVSGDGVQKGIAVDEQVVINPRDYLHKVKLPDPPPVSPEQEAALKKAKEAAANQKSREKSPGEKSPGGPPGSERPAGAGPPVAGSGGGDSPPGGSGGGRGGGRPNPAEFFTNLDKNSDSKISKDELPGSLAERLGDADTNGDGDLDRTEFLAAMAKMPRRGAGGGGAGGAGGGGGGPPGGPPGGAP